MNQRLHVLYIEDNDDNQRLVRRILEARGYTVMLASDGPAGIAHAREAHPDLILVDINIPGLNGYETTTRLRSMEHLDHVPIVAVTADTREGAREPRRMQIAGRLAGDHQDFTHATAPSPPPAPDACARSPARCASPPPAPLARPHPSRSPARGRAPRR